MSLTELFPDKLLELKRFRSDINSLWGADTALLRKVRMCLPQDPADLENKNFLAAGAEKCDVDPELYKRLSMTMKLLVTSVRSEKATAPEVIDFLREKLSPAGDSAERRASLVDLISATPEESIAAEETDAFSFGVTYRNVSVTPLIAPSKEKGRLNLRFGANIEIGFYAASEERSVSLNLSANELEGLIARLQIGLNALNDARKQVQVGVGGES